MSKSSFSTLNRWLGRKNKDKSVVNGKLSKSNTNLSISSTNINETSQLEYNRITPLPAATTNAPFEQTFRITVLLPKDQLYVTRLGARVPLSKLLELVCDNKLLDQEKYEFRNPVDASQIYSCDLTIGAVGLSEIRLCHKSESYDNFNSDEIIKLHRTSLIRESLSSSSEFSSRNSKHTTKTISPYSSTNSLNSMDSSAVSCGRPAKILQTKISAPPRKKRAAPRPPSQLVIPEKSPLIMENGEMVEKEPKQQSSALESSLATKDFSISTPNLTSSTMINGDINGNDCNGHVVEDYSSSGNGSLNSHGYADDTVLYAQVQKKNALNLNSQSKLNLEDEEINGNFPEPSPRKRIVQVKKKTAAPPAPPPRNSLYQEDAVSIASTNVSCNSGSSTPLELNATIKTPIENIEQSSKENNEAIEMPVPKPVPRITTSASTSSTLLNVTDVEHELKPLEESKVKSNISKVMLNRTLTPEPRSLSCEPPEMGHCYETQLEEFKQQSNTEDDCVSKQADSGIGEPVPSPLPDSLTPEVNNLDVKAHFESSSDDDDMVKVYNFKLGKTLVKPVSETKTLEELTIMNNGQEETDSELSTPLILTHANTPQTLSETSSWNFTIPISPPPNFADNNIAGADSKPDTPITPKITERPVLNFENLKQEPPEELKAKQVATSPSLCCSPLDSIVNELSSIIQQKGVDYLMKKPEEPQEIEAATPNTLSNFSINAITQCNSSKSKEILNEEVPKDNSPLTVVDYAKATIPLSSSSSSGSCSLPEEEKLYRKRSSITSLKQRKSITRSDSFHTTATTASPENTINLNKRTSSQLSLDQMAGSNLNRRRSSSELSIAESPSLQSLEVIKTILNSRKNSLANSNNSSSTSSSGSEEDNTVKLNTRRPSEELKFASLELKTSKNTGEDDDVQSKKETKNVELDGREPKELPKVYRYSGPPSINFSTWSERPKSQVAIKNEGDYIFGGAKSNKETINNYRFSPPPLNPKPTVKPGVIQRMGIPEKSYKVPVLVRPLQDVTIDKVPATAATNQAEPQLNGDVKRIQRPTVESVLRPQTQFIVNNGISATPRNIQRVVSTTTTTGGETVLRPQTQNIINTLPRSNKQRFSTTAATNCVVVGPQILRSSSIKQQQQNDQQEINNEACVPGPQILRSSSIKQQQQQQLETENCKQPPTPAPAPFGQNTLRRTGFKEKILAKEEEHEKQQQQLTTNKIHTMPATPPPNVGYKLANQKFNNSIITSAKLHLNLKQTNTSITTITGQKDFQTNNSCSPSFSAVTVRTAPITGANHNFTFTPSPPPAPSAPAPLKEAISIQLKPLGAQVQTPSPTATDDPRDQLLSAIRNFNKEGLKKA